MSSNRGSATIGGVQKLWCSFLGRRESNMTTHGMPSELRLEMRKRVALAPGLGWHPECTPRD